MSVVLALLQKNIRVMAAHRYKYLGVYLSPILILTLLLLIEHWAVSNFTWVNDNPPEYDIPAYPRCSGEDCLTIGYIVEGTRQPYIDAVIKHLKAANGLDDEDVQEMDVKAKDIMKYLATHKNKTQAVVVFCTDSHWQVQNYSVPCYAENRHLNFYTIIYNLSLFHKVPYFGNLKDSYPKDLVTIRLKADIDQAIIRHYHPQTNTQIHLTDFPSKTSRFIEGFSIFAQHGSFLLLLPYLLLLILQASQLMHQKQKRLRIGLNLVGVSHLQYYLSQLLIYVVSCIFITTIFCLSGLVFQIRFFTHSLLWFNFLLLLTNGLLIGLLGFIVAAVVSERNLGMSVVYGVVLYTIIIQWLFTGGLLIQRLYMEPTNLLIRVFKVLFNCSPSFHFSKIFNDVVKKADNHLDTLENRFVPGGQFTLNDLFTKFQQHFDKPIKQGYILPSAMESYLMMVVMIAVLCLLLLVLDRQIASNRGYTQPLCPKRARRNSTYSDDRLGEGVVVCTNLQKTYDNEVHALNGVSLTLQPNEVVVLLGENGAGKSTLLNIIIGLLLHSGGEILVMGQDVGRNTAALRKVTGVCPQFDILWEELTAGQHIEMFLKLKQLPFGEEQILQALETVSLQKNVDGGVDTFSGGMRRRLSLAISLLGNPKLVVLDEPTTGMDAKVRLQTWEMIRRLKQHCTVLLTTHNMEEAESVSDRIFIMVKGRIMAQGTTLQLKKQFGEGYVIKGYDVELNKDVLVKCNEEDLDSMLQKITQGKLRNWSLHETTLEEVFLKANNHY